MLSPIVICNLLSMVWDKKHLIDMLWVSVAADESCGQVMQEAREAVGVANSTPLTPTHAGAGSQDNQHCAHAVSILVIYDTFPSRCCG